MRCVVLFFLLVAVVMAGHFAHASSFTKGREVPPFTSALRPGDYIWLLKFRLRVRSSCW